EVVTRPWRSVELTVRLCAPALDGLHVIANGGALTVPMAFAPSKNVRLATAGSLVVVAATSTVSPTRAPGAGELTVGMTALPTSTKIVVMLLLPAWSYAR